LRKNITNTDLREIISFVSVVDQQLYYIMDFTQISIFVYNETWKYQRTIIPSSNEYLLYGPAYSIYINGSIYVTGNNVINKYDSYLNLTKHVDSFGANCGIYYNLANKTIYSGSTGSHDIDVYDEDLKYIRAISTNYAPWFITGYNGKLVVTDYDGNIYFYQGESLYRIVATHCTKIVTSVLFDNNNKMIVSCYDSNIYVYNVNGTYTGLQINACYDSFSSFVNFDSKDRLVFICSDRVEIFY
jgi:hypothetical protein